MLPVSEAHLYGGDGVGRLDDGACAEEPTVRGNVERLRGGLVFRAHRLLYHSTLGSRVTKKRKKKLVGATMAAGLCASQHTL